MYSNVEYLLFTAIVIYSIWVYGKRWYNSRKNPSKQYQDEEPVSHNTYAKRNPYASRENYVSNKTIRYNNSKGLSIGLKKPTKNLMAVFVIWCGIHLLLSLISITNDGNFFQNIFYGFFPITSNSYEYGPADFQNYTLEEPIIYILIPVIVYWVWTKIEEKYY